MNPGVSAIGCDGLSVSIACVRNGLELCCFVDPEPARDSARRRAHGRRADEKADAAVNREDGLAIVEAADRVDVRMGQELAPKLRRGVIGRESRREHEADASAAPGQRQCALDEHLIPIEMARTPDAGYTPEPRKNVFSAPPARSMSHGGFPSTASKPPFGEGRPACVEPGFGKLEHPVEELVRAHDLTGLVQQRRRQFFRKAAAMTGELVGERREDGRVRRSMRVGPHPARTPQIGNRLPSRGGAQPIEPSLFFAHHLGRVVTCLCEPSACGDGVRQRGLEIGVGKQRHLGATVS